MDSASLWNAVACPGISREEVELLRLALIKYGCGNWDKIMYHFPFLKTFQMNIQTQQMFGQQSLREFNDLHLDPKVILQKNALRTNIPRKSGVIVAKTTKAERMKAREEYKKLEVPEEERSKIHIPIHVGSTPEVGQRDDAMSACHEIFLLSRLQYKARRLVYRKEAEELLEKRGGEGNLDAILEELRLARIKVYQKKLDEEELVYQRILKEREAEEKMMDITEAEL